jgi:hypothetical protein
VRQLFATNFFGPVAMIKAALRQRWSDRRFQTCGGGLCRYPFRQ